MGEQRSEERGASGGYSDGGGPVSPHCPSRSCGPGRPGPGPKQGKRGRGVSGPRQGEMERLGRAEEVATHGTYPTWH